MSNNMRYYDYARSVPESAQKQFSNGRFSGTDINPMWRIKVLTEMFGPCGIGWYYEVLSERCEVHGAQTIAVVDLNLYVKDGGEWSKPIFGTGGNLLVNAKGMVSDEGYKMALTDALSIACKSLGIGADIWYAKDETKYTRKSKENTEDAPAAEPQKMATEAQKKVLAAKLAPDQYAAMQAKYGANLERLTADVAGRALVKANGGVVA